MSATGVPPSGSGPAPAPAVLIVDDEAATRALLRKTVQDLYPSARINEASNGEAALRLARASRPDLVLLDIVLPGSDTSGVLVCQELTKAMIPVLIVSGNASGPVLDACLSLGAADILRKPFTLEAAQAKIKGCIGR
ncbi:MAG: two-component system response regulator [Armatimonadota bacterium]